MDLDKDQHARHGEHEPWTIHELVPQPRRGSVRGRLGLSRLRHPVAAFVVATALFGLIVVFAAAIIRTTRRWFSRRTVTTVESHARNFPAQRRW